MGTYEKSYGIKWVNFNVQDNQMSASYKTTITLDNGNKINAPDFRAIVENQQYYDLFTIPATIWNKETTLGEFIGYMAACAAQLKDPEFPIAQEQLDKWGTQGKDLLDPNQ